MKSTKNLRLRLRLMEGALLLLLGVLTTAAVSTHQLLLDAANHPASDFDLTSTHVVGTLDGARLPASVPQVAGGQWDLTGTQILASSFGFDMYGGGEVILPGPGGVAGGIVFQSRATQLDEFSLDGTGSATLYGSLFAGVQVETPYLLCDGHFQSDGAQISSDGNGSLTASSFVTQQGPIIDASGNLILHPGAGLFLAGGYQPIIDDVGNVNGANLSVGGGIEASSFVCNSYFQSDAGNIFSDGSGSLRANDFSVGPGLCVDPSGNFILQIGSGLFVAGAGTPLIDSAGNANLGSIAASATVIAAGGVGAFGKTPPPTRPATPTTLAQAIAVLQAYGLCQ